MSSSDEHRPRSESLRWLEGKTIVFVGDSITADLTANYVTLTADRLADQIDITELTIVNSGVDSSSIFDALDRLPDILIEHEPDAFVVLLGVNDSKMFRQIDQPLVPPEAFGRAYGVFLDKVDATRRVPKVLLTPPPPLFDVVLHGELLAKYWYWKEDLYAQYIDAIKHLATRPQCVVADAFQVFLKEANPSRLFSADGVHPNILGHRLLSECVLDGLRRCHS
jgi:lysophospholipase L1-like esterase